MEPAGQRCWAEELQPPLGQATLFSYTKASENLAQNLVRAQHAARYLTQELRGGAQLFGSDHEI